MKSLFKFLISIGNFFLGAYVSYKIYGYFSPHVGFSLPQLTYSNMLALSFVVSAIIPTIGILLKLQIIQDKIFGEEKTETWEVFYKTIAYLLIWLFSWFYFLILF